VDEKLTKELRTTRSQRQGSWRKSPPGTTHAYTDRQTDASYGGQGCSQYTVHTQVFDGRDYPGRPVTEETFIHSHPS